VITCSQHGSLTVFVAVLATALLSLVGLVVDAGRAVAARAAAMDDAVQAARAGAGQLSVAAVRAGSVELDPTAAIGAADSYLASAGQQGHASVAGDKVVVTIEESEPTVMLQIVGINRIAVTATATATNVHGVSGAD
jgi:Flp pilus assembly protein TadG